MRARVRPALGLAFAVLAMQLGAQATSDAKKAASSAQQSFDIKIKVINDIPPPLHHRSSFFSFLDRVVHRQPPPKNAQMAEQHLTASLDTQSMIKMQAAQELILLGVTPRYKDGTLVTLIISGKIWTRVHRPPSEDDGVSVAPYNEAGAPDHPCDRNDTCHNQHTDEWLKRDKQFRYKSFSYTADTALNQKVTVYPLGRSDNRNNLRIELSLSEPAK